MLYPIFDHRLSTVDANICQINQSRPISDMETTFLYTVSLLAGNI